MTISLRQLTAAVVVSFCVGALVTPVRTQGQAGSQAPPAATAVTQPSFMLVEFMKVAQGKQADWLKLERETWKPMHALRVKDGGIQSWMAMAQWLPGDESDGPVYGTVTTFRGFPDPLKTNFQALFKQAHPQGDYMSMQAQTQSARSIVRSEIWQVLDQTSPTTMSSK
jgi:hypothetical protein